MPLHNWSEVPGWEGVHQVWMVELLYWIKPRLPAGYRAYIGTTPTFAIGVPGDERPDLGVHTVPPGNGSPTPTTPLPTAADPGDDPDQEIAVATLAQEPTLLVERQ